ncbi:Uncharacterised protein [Weissella viridescens]|uniref:ATP-dependent RecD2 DNA helicase OB-fold domain-containing protein n=1 Tax=Weissella viridescens TaxID=1629 RepID=A0A380P7K5_WEIVI|nr:Uncharacterised protein [Weissella viridescens]
MTVTGSFGDIQIGGDYTFAGRITTHARYGEQFLAEIINAKPLLQRRV